MTLISIAVAVIGIWMSTNAAKRATEDYSGKIAVKVINHYGDEVLKVFSIAQ